MLSEAAEIEHCLMCTYLYAVFSMKQSENEDLEPDELRAVGRWRSEITAIAIDEMLHLVLVNNLLISIGARPHYRRFNFPISPGLFPADVAVALAPLDAATLDHFIYLERPRSVVEQDAAVFDKRPYQRAGLAGRLMDAVDDYATVGELYETIGASFIELAGKLGEAGLLVGARSDQLSARDVQMPHLCTIASLADVAAAITLIVHQGEGSADSSEHSHYSRFRRIRDQWRELALSRPGFMPSRPAARNPLMRTPVVTGERVQITAEPALSLVDIGNAAYGLMLRLLALLSDAHQCPPERARVVEQGLALMHALTDIGSAITRLPANPAHPGQNAGLTFTVSRTSLEYPSREAAAWLVAERLEMLAERAAELTGHLPILAVHGRRWLKDAEFWKAWGRKAPISTGGSKTMVTPHNAASEASEPNPGEPAASAVSNISSAVTVAAGRDVTIRFDATRCIHARHCVTAEPEVFLANTPGEWIFPDRADWTRLAIVAHDCPSGAIRLTRQDGKPGETAPAVNLVRVRENGPLAVHAEIELAQASGPGESGFRMTLCRCGQSHNKPFCDGSHVAAGFQASGEPPTRPSDPLPTRNKVLRIVPLQNGPLAFRGALEICSGTGRTVDRLDEVRLCRCGHSENKPFCDGTHLRIGFEAAGASA